MKIEVFQTHFYEDLSRNHNHILQKYKTSKADVCIFPELSTIGYLPQDLLFNQAFINNILEINDKIIAYTTKKAIIFGSIMQKNGKLFNAGIVAQNSKIIGISTKKCLPNIGVFSENRYFTSGTPSVVPINGINFGILICEDLWYKESYTQLKNVDFLCSINASPFEIFPDGKTKLQKRMEVFKKHSSVFKKPLIYCNCIGFYNGILFDGNSFVLGKNLHIMKSFKEDSYFFQLPIQLRISRYCNQNTTQLCKEAIIFGIREFFQKTGQQKAIIGLSGGADSALVATLATEALGYDNIICIAIPSQYTSKESIDDATALSQNLGVELRSISIEKIVQCYKNLLNINGTTLENIQARIRGNILMSISNQENGLVLTTGNKSEVAVGYCTLYGDMCGALNPIKDLYKTEVFEMMQYINQNKKIIPHNIIVKEPTAELRENQKDSDSLPKYEILDAILKQLIEEGKLASEITNFETPLVEKIQKMLKNAEFKRWQSCVGIKLTSKSFEKSDWKFNL